MNRNVTVRQCSGRLEDRTGGGNPVNREVVQPDDRRIAQNNGGVLDRSAVEQAARTADNGCVPFGVGSTYLAFHFVAAVVLVMHLAGICALMVGLEIEMAFTSTIIYLVALTLILMRR